MGCYEFKCPHCKGAHLRLEQVIYNDFSVECLKVENGKTNHTLSNIPGTLEVEHIYVCTSCDSEWFSFDNLLAEGCLGTTPNTQTDWLDKLLSKKTNTRKLESKIKSSCKWISADVHEGDKIVYISYLFSIKYSKLFYSPYEVYTGHKDIKVAIMKLMDTCLKLSESDPAAYAQLKQCVSEDINSFRN